MTYTIYILVYGNYKDHSVHQQDMCNRISLVPVYIGSVKRFCHIDRRFRT